MFIITPNDLTTAGISINTVEAAVRRKTFQKVGRGEYNYVTLPETWKEALKVTLWGGLEPADWAQRMQTLREAVAKRNGEDSQLTALKQAWDNVQALHRTADTEYLLTLKPCAGGKGLPVKWVHEIVRSAGLLTLLAQLDTPTQVRSAFAGVIRTKAELRETVVRLIWQECAWQLVDREGKKAVHEPETHKDILKGLRIANVQVLQRAERAFAEALEAEVEGVPAGFVAAERRKNALQSILKRLKLGNQNTRKVGRAERKVFAGGRFDVHELLILEAVANPDGSVVRNTPQAYYHYVARCLEKNVQPVTQSTFYRYASDPNTQMLIAKERLGAKKSNDLYRPFVSAQRSQMGGSLVAMDGWVPEIPYRTRLSNGTTEVRKRLAVVFLVDHATGCPLGWAIGASETGLLARQAMRRMMALNGGRAAREIVMDNGSAFTSGLSRHTLKVVADVVSPIAVGNSQANPAETYIRTHLKAALATVEGFVGGNMSSKHTDVPNPDYYPKTAQLPTFEELSAMLDGVFARIAAELGADGKSRRERYLETLNPACRQVGVLEQRAAFAHRLGPVRVERGEVTVQFGQVVQHDLRRRPAPIKHCYAVDVPTTLAIETANRKKVVVMFDEEHPETVDLYNYDPKQPDNADLDRYLATVEYKGLASKGVAERTPEGLAALGKQVAAKKAFDQAQTRMEEDLRQGLDELEVGGDLHEDAELVLAVPFTADAKRFKTHYNEAELLMLGKRLHDDAVSLERSENRRRVAEKAPAQTAKEAKLARYRAAMEHEDSDL